MTEFYVFFGLGFRSCVFWIIQILLKLHQTTLLTVFGKFKEARQFGRDLEKVKSELFPVCLNGCQYLCRGLASLCRTNLRGSEYARTVLPKLLP